MFTISHSNSKKTPYIRSSAYENLFVLPYVNCRLIFAEMAVRAIGIGGFDKVVVDLPLFLNDEEWLRLPIEAFPFASSLIIRRGDDDFRTYTFVPNDAACAAVYMVFRLQETGRPMELECVDDSNIISYAKESFTLPEVVLRDDFFAFTDGPSAYFSPLYKQLDSEWATLSDDVKFFWEYRANMVAERLHNSLKPGKKTLFVCNFRLWWRIQKKLSSGRFENRKSFFMPWTDQQAALVFQDPYLMWINGLLDDYPAVVLSFFMDRMLEMAPLVFDKLEILDEMLQDCIEGNNGRHERGFSTRRVKAFRRYLLRRLATHRWLTPQLTSYLDQAAVSCLGRPLAQTLSKALLAYPVMDDDEFIYMTIRYTNMALTDAAFEIPDEFMQVVVNSSISQASTNLFGDYLDTVEKRQQLVSRIHPFLTRKESRQLRGSSTTTWAVGKEYRFHAEINQMVREAVERQSRLTRVVRSWGSLGKGIDWKQTLWSKASGESAVYIRKAKRSPFNSFDLNPFTPVVFVFDETEDVLLHSVYDSNKARRSLDLLEPIEAYDTDEPDYVYSLFYTIIDCASLCEGHIRKERITAILFLCTSSWMGLERYAQITQRPEKYQCRLLPDEDSELSPFSYPEKLIAIGVKYAEKVMIVAADASWKPSSKLVTFANTRHVKIIPVRLSLFSQEVIDRMKSIHMISTSLKKYVGAKTIVDRFVPDPS